jgi:hypothetical protein
MQIPGVDWLVAAVIIAKIGVDMSVFLSVYRLSAWAGVCPGNHESAGRQRSGRARKGNLRLRTILVGAAISAGRTKGGYLKDKFHRLKARRGPLRAALAIAHKILVAAITCSPTAWPIANSQKPISTKSAGPRRRQPEAPPRTPRLSHHAPANRRGRLSRFSWQGIRPKP